MKTKKKNRLIRTLALLILSCVLLSSLSACAISPHDPSKTVKKFQRSYNSLDWDGLLDCIDPALAGSARSILSMVGDLLDVGIDLNDLMQAAPLLAQVLPEDALGKMPQIDLDIVSSDTYGDTAMVYTIEKNSNCHLTFELENMDGEWYIMNLTESGE